MDIVKELKNILKDYLNKKIIVAVSGGVDSIVLLDVVSKIYRKKDIIVAHFDHGLRSESNKDKLFVSKIAKNYGLRFLSGNARNLVNKKGNLEENARDARYNFLLKTAYNNNIKNIIIAHHGDDQLETVFMNNYRGCDVNGLTGMNLLTEKVYKNNIFYILRPFINFYKTDLESYQIINKLIYVEDKTNFDKKYFRNKVRHDIVFALSKKTKNNIIKEINYLKSLKEKLDNQISLILKSIILNKFINYVSIKKKEFLSFGDNLKAELIKEIIKSLKGSLKDIESKNMLMLIDKINENKVGINVEVKNGVNVYIDYERIVFTSKKIKEFRIKNKQLKLENSNFGMFSLFLTIEKSIKKDNRLYLDYDKINFPIKISSYKPGMKIKIINVGTKKIQDLFVDKKIEKRFRSFFPVLIDKKNEVIAVVDLLVSASCHANKKTVKYLVIDIKN